MALTKADASLAQVTATGNTAEASLSDAYSGVFTVTHANGTGTITAGAQVQPQISHDGTNFSNDGGAFVFGTTASTTEARTYTPPEGGLTVQKVRFSYTAPSGSTGHTLNVRYSRVTGI